MVEALDTTTGTWRTAFLTVVSCLTVSLKFPGFPKYSDVTEHMSTEQNTDGIWPIRGETTVIILASRAKRIFQAALGYEANTRILRDVVSNYREESP